MRKGCLTPLLIVSVVSVTCHRREKRQGRVVPESWVPNSHSMLGRPVLNSLQMNTFLAKEFSCSLCMTYTKGSGIGTVWNLKERHRPQSTLPSWVLSASSPHCYADADRREPVSFVGWRNIACFLHLLEYPQSHRRKERKSWIAFHAERPWI